MIVCLDLETTGLDKKKDEIIEIALVKFDEVTFEVIDTFSTFIDPEVKIPDLITNITNISNEDVLGEPLLEEVTNKVLSFIGDAPLLGHNVFFDRDFLIEKGIDVTENLVLDTFFLANFLKHDEASLNLEMLCNSYGIGFSGAHRALNDVQATIALFQKLVEEFKELPSNKKDILYYIFNNSSDVSVGFLRDYLYGIRLDQVDGEFFRTTILDNIGLESFPEEIHVDTSVTSTTPSHVLENLGGLEGRENQEKMSHLVMSTLSKSKHVSIEAPTGLGKSFAYLIPSILHSLETGEKVYVSTKTKNLQDQLYVKDLEYLKEHMGYDFRYTKLKGKRNYISLYLFFTDISLGHFSYKKTCFFLKIANWLMSTKYGEVDELNYYGEEYGFLKLISSDNYIITNTKNRYTEYEFLYKARKKVEFSNIVIINHSLLFSDIASESSILGDIDNLVIDEAHSIEDSVTESLRRKITLRQVEETISTIEKVLSQKKIKKIEYIKHSDSMISNLSLFMDEALSYLNTKFSQSSTYKTVLIQKDFYSDIDFHELYKKIQIDMLSIIDYLSTIDDFDFSKEKSILQDYLDILKVLMDKESPSTYINVITLHDVYGLSIEYTLLNPGEYINENIWTDIPSIVLTSATLQIGNSFDYISKMLSLDNFEFTSFETDFDYSKQASLFIPNDLGSVKYNSNQIVAFLKDFYSIVKGNTLTLLTSFSIIRKIYTELNGDLKKQDISLYAQSIGGSKSKLLSSFVGQSESSILLGTDSFWEGVDIPGEHIKYLVIHKFPFPVPTDPIFIARSVFFDDPFMEYSVPKSIIKLQQGFGRLIRSKQDKGIVVLLDDRIHSTRWGKAFYSAFPDNINVKIVESKSFLDILKKI